MQLYEESLVSNSLQSSNNHKMFDEHSFDLKKKTKSFFFSRNTRYNLASLSVIIAMPDPPSHERRLETSYTVQLG